MPAEKNVSREVTNKDLEVIDKAIADHEKFQTELYALRRVLGEIGKLDIASIRRGVEAEQSRLDDVRQRADAAQQQLSQLEKQIEGKQRELIAAETLTQERALVANQLNEAILRMRNLLEAA
jgi:hypothetical protein